MAKPNYRHAKKQKEATRKARQEAKQNRRSHVQAMAGAADVPATDAPTEPAPAKPLE